MARRGRRRNHTILPDAIAPGSLDESLFGDLTPSSQPDLVSIEDHRRFNPDLDWGSTLHTIDARRIEPLQVARPSKLLRNALRYPHHRVRFAAPAKTIVCVRRKQRREVFFAKNLKRGRGGGRRTKWSSVQC